jgi:hypothetical protein
MSRRKETPSLKVTELAALKKEVHRLKQENDLLKSGNGIWRNAIRMIWIHPQIQRPVRRSHVVPMVVGIA